MTTHLKMDPSRFSVICSKNNFVEIIYSLQYIKYHKEADIVSIALKLHEILPAGSMWKKQELNLEDPHYKDL